MKREREKRLDRALEEADLDTAAEELALWRALERQPGDTQETPEVSFDDIRDRLPLRAPAARRRRRRWRPQLALAGFATVAAAAALLVAVWPRGSPETPWRPKGEPRCCGDVRIRLGDSSRAPPRREAGFRTVWPRVQLSQPGWASLFDVRLATHEVTRLVDATELPAGESALAGPGEGLKIAGEGRHVLALVVTAGPLTLERSEVVGLLHAVAQGQETRARGDACSVGIYNLDVP